MLLLYAFISRGAVTIVTLFISVIWPMVFTILTGRKQIREEHTQVAEIFGAKRGK